MLILCENSTQKVEEINSSTVQMFIFTPILSIYFGQGYITYPMLPHSYMSIYISLFIL